MLGWDITDFGTGRLSTTSARCSTPCATASIDDTSVGVPFCREVHRTCSNGQRLHQALPRGQDRGHHQPRRRHAAWSTCGTSTPRRARSSTRTSTSTWTASSTPSSPARKSIEVHPGNSISPDALHRPHLRRPSPAAAIWSWARSPPSTTTTPTTTSSSRASRFADVDEDEPIVHARSATNTTSSENKTIQGAAESHDSAAPLLHRSAPLSRRCAAGFLLHALLPPPNHFLSAPGSGRIPFCTRAGRSGSGRRLRFHT